MNELQSFALHCLLLRGALYQILQIRLDPEMFLYLEVVLYPEAVLYPRGHARLFKR